MPVETAGKKSALLADQLRHRIQLGELEPGARLPSFSELRRELGIAPATVERVYASLENEGFVVRRQGAGTFVAHPGEANGGGSGKGPRTGYIGFVASGVQEAPRAPIWTHLLDSVQATVEQQNRRVILLSSHSALGWDDVEGVLLAETDYSMALSQRPAHLPCVALQYPVPSLATVMADEFEGGRLATRHLLELGHRRIAMLHFGTETRSDEVTTRRLAGYQSALREAGIAASPDWERGFSNPPGSEVEPGTNIHLVGGYAAMQAWLRAGWNKAACTALVAQNDQVAIGAMRALREAGLVVPRQLSVVGFDGTETGEGCVPRLTSVRVPVEEIAVVGVDLLSRQISGGERAPQRIVLPPSLVIRDSTAPPGG